MDYLARESADLSDGLWNRIDETVIGTARAQLTCRRFLKVFGPLGAGVTTVAVDGVNKEEVLEDGIGKRVFCKFAQHQPSPPLRSGEFKEGDSTTIP